jgi:ABC-type branched-subunit amino acid transport system substrate-binding protein
MLLRRLLLSAGMAILFACSKEPSQADRSASELVANVAKPIKIGQTMAYSGPASAYGTIGKLQAAFFNKVNEEGGVSGRPIEFLSLDDAYSPSKAVEHVRRLVEQDEVLLLFQPLGTASNSAIQKYLNAKQVPHLFVASGATKWGDAKGAPWTIGFNPSYQLEGKAYAEAILKSTPDAKIAVLYQNDDFGKDLLEGLREGLADKAKMIVAEASYEVSDPTIESQIATLKASKADTFVNITTPKFAAQAIRGAHDLGWRPTQYVANVSASVGSVLQPAGLEKAKGLLTVMYFKDPNDKQWAADPGMTEWRTFMNKYYPEGSLVDGANMYAYVAAQTMLQVLKQCAGTFTRKNIMAQATNLRGFAPPQLLPGVSINTSPGDYFLFDRLEFARFDGETWSAITN